LAATNNKIRNERMQDSELILRFMALYSLEDVRENSENLDDFLNAFVELKSKKWEREKWKDIENAFKKAMVFAPKIFGKIAFRKYSGKDESLKPINRGMFETQAVAIAKLSKADLEVLVLKRALVNQGLKALQHDKQFSGALLYATGRGTSSNIRLNKICTMFNEVLNA
jgi:hypothetical protein